MNTTPNTVMPIGNDGLANARHELAVAVGSQYGAMRRYAESLNDAFEYAWYEVAHTDTGADAKLVHAEKSELFKELKAVNHSNPSTIWKRVREYGKEMREGKQEEGEEGNGANANAQRSPMLRNIEELTTLYKFNSKLEEMPAKVRDAQVHIKNALGALGVDINAL